MRSPRGRDQRAPGGKLDGDGISRLVEGGQLLERGGIFFDDFAEGGFANGFALMRAVGDALLPAYLPIVQRRRALPYGERERDFQCYRRGRYVEFNLVFDRGTLFGLQSGGRVESILMSMPPVVTWRYDWQPAPGTPEARLYSDFLRPRDWAGDAPPAGAGATPR